MPLANIFLSFLSPPDSPVLNMTTLRQQKPPLAAAEKVNSILLFTVLFIKTRPSNLSTVAYLELVRNAEY